MYWYLALDMRIRGPIGYCAPASRIIITTIAVVGVGTLMDGYYVPSPVSD